MYHATFLRGASLRRPVEWGESRNLKLTRAFLIAFPSAFVFFRFFQVLDTIDRAHGGAGVSGLWIWVALGLLVGATWVLPVPRPEVLRLPRRGGSPRGWRWRLVRAALITGAFLVVFGVFWEVANRVTSADAGTAAGEAWAALFVFAFLYVTASLLLVVEPGETLVGDLHPWGPAELRAARRFASSFVLGWALVAGSLLAILALSGADLASLDLASLVPAFLFFGTIFGLTLHVLWNTVGTRRSVALADKET